MELSERSVSQIEETSTGKALRLGHAYRLENSLENSGWSAVSEIECRIKVPEVDR